MRNILIVDEKSVYREILAEELAAVGYTVLSTGDSRLAQQVIESTRLDLLLLDPRIQGEGRWDLVREIKRKQAQLPILLMTESRPNPGDFILGLAEGFLFKGAYRDELREKLVGILIGKEKGTDRVH